MSKAFVSEQRPRSSAKNFYTLPCFVISREKDFQRRARTSKRLEEQGISFEWFDASDGHLLSSEEFLKEGIVMDCPGSCGCALSHKRLWKKMVDEGIDGAIVFEDDIVFHEKFQELLPEFWDQTPQTNSIVFLGYCCYWGAMGQSKVVENFPLTTHAYYITKNVAQWFLDHFGSCTEHLDLHMKNLYHSHPHDWKCYLWWEGKHRSPLNNQTRLNVCFNGLVFQDHNLQNVIRPGLE